MSEEFKKENDYSVSVFAETGFLCKSTYVQSPLKYAQWLENTKYKNWVYMNVYVRRSKRFLGRYYKGSYIPYNPK